MWIIYALLSAVFAALTTILAKICVENVDSTLATAIRTAVVLVMAWGMVFLLSLIHISSARCTLRLRTRASRWVC